MSRDQRDASSSPSGGAGRPSIIPGVEARIGMTLEQYALERLQLGEGLTAIADRVDINRRTLKRHLVARGYRIERSVQSSERLIRVRRPRPGRSPAARRRSAPRQPA